MISFAMFGRLEFLFGRGFLDGRYQPGLALSKLHFQQVSFSK